MQKHTTQFGQSFVRQNSWGIEAALSANCLVAAKRPGLYERKDFSHPIVN